MNEQTPTIGRIVLYHTTEEERKAMENSFKDRGYSQNVAKVLPAIVVAVWGSTSINLKVFVDGYGELWKTSVNLVNSDNPEGNWEWPNISAKPKEEATRPVDSITKLKQYIGSKTIAAAPMSECTFLEREKGQDTRNREDSPGYLVVYPDGYRSWSPKDVFEAAYDELLVGINGNGSALLAASVFPSDILSIAVAPDVDYNGAHQYQFQNSAGFSEGQAKYVDSYQKIQFVQKNADGSMTPGLQSEQLTLALLDRTQKLNARFPSEFNERMMAGLNMFLDACQDRIQDRMDRGVMGELKK